MFIITKLDVNKNIVFLVNDKTYEYKENALSIIFGYIDDQQDQRAYINKIIDEQYIEVYIIEKGFLYNTKKLDHIYQILEIT